MSNLVRVIDSETGEGLPGAHLVGNTTTGQVAGVVTNAQGVANLDEPVIVGGGSGTFADDAILRVTFIGYVPYELDLSRWFGEDVPMIFDETGNELPTAEVFGDLPKAAKFGGVALLLLAAFMLTRKK